MNGHRLHRFKKQITQIIILSTIYYLLSTTIGCEAFVRKFTRKSKKEQLQQEELVLVPEEYTCKATKEELYRQYFLFWKSWHDELINSLTVGANHKKQITAAGEALKNLEQLKAMLNEEKQKKLEVYIDKLKSLSELIAKDIYGNNIGNNRWEAERLKKSILRDFSYNKIKNSLA